MRYIYNNLDQPSEQPVQVSEVKDQGFQQRRSVLEKRKGEVVASE
jgi:hypothetical protein